MLTAVLVSGLALGLSAASAWAGNTNSPAAPDNAVSAMYTLDDIYNRLTTGATTNKEVFAEPASGPGSTMHTLNDIYEAIPHLPKTGQTTSYQTGDDGEYEKGVARPVPRFTSGSDAASNCVTDNLTGLMWLKNPDATTRTLTDAIAYCEGLDGTSGRGGYTDWRMPNVLELLSLIDYGRFDPALPSGHPFSVGSITCSSGTTYLGHPGYQWNVGTGGGGADIGLKTSAFRVWPVRGGQ
jgi:hypothetical protein